ncbi:serine/threonine-protein phosphatase 6 regulatory ankyrin repeat subunit B-like [Saccostrea echinata]|uniref:serine/threonine-protein phosphatase 6 regulatory ankyrin repeat subunit B-like n=1 Tax=Saccostrea echinata TaxID=191078 RepID=UPI002A7EB0C4|nr:serine/threonine-protein phosphatase 6 regulatory ankyrin repeat subunit B-like [Saccostrea echinata]
MSIHRKADMIIENMATNTYKPFAKLGQFIKQIFEDDDESDSPNLHQLARAGNEAQLQEIINNGCDVNLEDSDGLTALYIATKRSHTKIVEILLQNGACVNTKHNPLHIVRDLAIAHLLLQAKGDLNARDEYGNTPLHKAIIAGKENLVEFYLSVGADIYQMNAKKQTALHTLCSSFMEEPHGSKLARTLIEGGVSVNCKNWLNRSPLHLAAIHYHLDKLQTICTLIKAGASLSDLDLQGLNPIHHYFEQSRGCSDDKEEVSLTFIDSLIVDEQAADHRTAIGQTILHLAIRDIPLQILKHLVRKGCQLNAKDSRQQGLLHYLVDRDDSTTIIQYLVDMGLDVNDHDIWGQTVLHLAVEKNKKKLVETLVSLGAEVNVKDSIERQAIHIAAEHGWDFILEFLLQKGANINSLDKYQSTPLHFAAWNNKSSIAYTLVNYGCDVGCKDARGQTAKDVAQFRSSIDFLQILDEHGLEYQKHKEMSFSKHANKLLHLKDFQDILNSNETLRDPENLNEYLINLITTSPTGILHRDSEALEIHTAVDEFAINAAKCLSQSDPKLECTVYPVGSSSEGTKTLYPDEFDYIVCFEKLSENIYPRHEKEDIQESIFLISDKDTEMREVLKEGVDFDETLYSVSDYTRIFLKKEAINTYSELTEMESKIVPNHTMFQTFTQRVSKIVFNESFPKDDRLLIKDVSNDPKIVLLWRGSKYKSLEINVDFVPAVRLSSWPNKLRINSKIFGQDLLRLPCLAVPKMTSQEDENLWRCSLSLVEIAIMKRCRPHIRNSYIAAKSLISSAVCPLVSFGDYEEAKDYYRSRHDSMSSEEEFELFEELGDILPSYILKMAFLHVIEEKATRDGVETVFDDVLYERDPIDQLILTSESIAHFSRTFVCKECDPNVVKGIFQKCHEWLSDQFVPSFFNPRHNVLGSRMLDEDGVKVQKFIKFIVKLLGEN